MDNLYSENKNLIEKNNLHQVKSQADYREELYEQYLTQHETIQDTRKKMQLPKSSGPINNKVVPGIKATTFVKGEQLFGKKESEKEREYVLGSDTQDLQNIQEITKKNKNKWEINNMFRTYFEKRSREMIRYLWNDLIKKSVYEFEYFFAGPSARV